jgi:hypothetical protein
MIIQTRKQAAAPIQYGLFSERLFFFDATHRRMAPTTGGPNTWISLAKNTSASLPEKSSGESTRIGGSACVLSRLGDAKWTNGALAGNYFGGAAADYCQLELRFRVSWK